MSRLIIMLLLLCGSLGLIAQSPEETKMTEQAHALFEHGDFASAFPLYSQLLSLHPQDADLNFRFGTCALYAGQEKEKVVKHLTIAIKKGCSDPRVYFYLGKAHHLNYDFATARVNYKIYQTKLSPKEKNPLPVERNLAMCEQGSSLLKNIRDIVVLEKTQGATSDFFRYYNLEEIGGKIIVTPEELLTKFDVKKELVSLVHFPGNSTRIYFTSYGKDGTTGKDIYRADLLPGGTFSTPEKLAGAINTPFDEDYAFMHPDGKTFYFASTGHNSMGGYDIFKSTYNPATDSFSEPENLDFAINTPDDDLFYVVDSLKETAYFASARSSAQNELHIYKVMVRSLPVKSLFIQGDFLSEIAGIGDNAKITVKDELTQKVVFDRQIAKGDNAYIMDLPKGGLYAIEVRPENGTIVHKASFEAPIMDETAAYKQILKLLEVDGNEKLVIINEFDTPLQTDLAALAADMLRRKAGLDVNVSEEALKELENSEQNGETLEAELTAERLPGMAGFGDGRSVGVIAADLMNSADNDAKKANADIAKANEFLSRSAEQAKLSSALMKEAEEVMKGVDKSDEAAYIAKLTEYNQKLDQATEYQQEAENLAVTASYLNKNAENLQKAADRKSNQSKTLTEQIASNDLQGALSVLNSVYAEKDQDVSNLVMDEMNQLASEQEKEQKILASKVENLRQEESLLETKVNQIDKELAAAKKNNVIIQLTDEKKQLEDQLASTREDILSYNERINLAGKGEEQTKQQLALFAEATNSERSLNDAVTFNTNQLQGVQQTLASNKERIDLLTNTDAETIGLIANADASAKAARPENNFEERLKSIVASGVAVESKERALKRATALEVSTALQSLEKAKSRESSPEKLAEIDAEIASLREKQAQLTQEPIETASSDEAVATANKYFEGALTRPTGSTELERSIEQIGTNSAMLAAINKRIAQNDRAILESDDVAEVDALERENNELIASKYYFEKLKAEALTDLQIAYESSRKEVIDGNDTYQQKLEQQIRLTEDYIQTLSSLTISSKDPAFEQQKTELLISAQNRLQNYNSDLDLVVSTSEEPAVAPARIASLPQNESMAIAAIYPEYDTEISNAEQFTGLEKDAELMRISEELSARAYAEIDMREKAIDATEKEDEKERLLAEITLLEKVSGVRIESEAPALMDLALAAQPIQNIDADHLTDNPEMVKLEEKLSSVESYAENQAILENSQAKIDSLEKAMRSAESRGQEKKIDREMEKTYFERSKAEVLTTRAINFAAEESFNERANEIRISLNENRALWEKNPTLSTHFALEQNRAKNLMSAAEITRDEAAPEIDEVKQAYEFRQAAAMQVEALAIQSRLENLIASLPELSKLSEDELTAVLSGAYLEQQMAENAASELTVANSTEAENDESNQESLALESGNTSENSQETSFEEIAQVEEISVPNETTDQAMDQRADDKPVEELMADLMETRQTVTMEVENTEVSRAALVNLASNTDLQTQWTTTYGLTPEEVEALWQKTELKALKDQKTAIDLAAERLEAALVIYEQNTADLAEVNEEIEELKAEFNTPGADKTAVFNELTLRYDEADVIYASLEELKAEISDAQASMQQSRSEFDQTMVTLNAAEIVAEVREELTKSVNTNIEEPVAAVEPKSTPVVEPETTVAEVIPTEPKDKVTYATTNRFEEYLFSYPKELKTEVFALTDKPAYGKDQPIPMNPELPGGIIYKVQVGAFRKSIPADHFSQFAPLAGEVLTNGITRYTAGLFMQYTSANEAKNEIRQKGYRDAFVVAFKDGKRISLAEARKLNPTKEAEILASVTSSTTVNKAANASNNSANKVNSGTTNTTSAVATSTAAASSESKPTTPREVEAAPKPTPEIASFAGDWSNETGTYYTVQIGVYSRQVALKDMYGLNEVMAEKLTNGLIRYTSGKFTSAQEAEARKLEARKNGIKDAFVTAYVNGKKVNPSTLAAPASNAGGRYQVVIGTYSGGPIPISMVEALLKLEKKWGVMQIKEEGKVTYLTNILSEADANKALADFQSYGLNQAQVRKLN